jgi:hypothetical protein
MPIIEILTIETPPTFVVNTAANEVAIALPEAPATIYGRFANAELVPKPQLIPEDHFIVKSITLRLPYCFTMSTGICKAGFSFRNFGVLAIQPIIEIGWRGMLAIPEPDQEISLETRVQWEPITYTVRAAIVLSSLYLNVSMVGVPAALNGTTQEVQIALKILHNEPMVV